MKKKANLCKKYLSVRNKKYLKWCICNMIKWEKLKPFENIIHIHRTKDTVFPIKNAIKIKEGTHTMILTKAKKYHKLFTKI